MIDVQIARLIANQIISLEFCDEDDIHPDTAIKITEYLLSDIEGIDKEFLQKLIDAFPVIALEYDDNLAEFVSKIPVTFSLLEMLDAEDPDESDDLDGTDGLAEP